MSGTEIAIGTAIKSEIVTCTAAEETGSAASDPQDIGSCLGAANARIANGGRQKGGQFAKVEVPAIILIALGQTSAKDDIEISVATTVTGMRTSSITGARQVTIRHRRKERSQWTRRSPTSV